LYFTPPLLDAHPFWRDSQPCKSHPTASPAAFDRPRSCCSRSKRTTSANGRHCVIGHTRHESSTAPVGSAPRVSDQGSALLTVRRDRKSTRLNSSHEW